MSDPQEPTPQNPPPPAADTSASPAKTSRKPIATVPETDPAPATDKAPPAPTPGPAPAPAPAAPGQPAVCTLIGLNGSSAGTGCFTAQRPVTATLFDTMPTTTTDTGMPASPTLSSVASQSVPSYFSLTGAPPTPANVTPPLTWDPAPSLFLAAPEGVPLDPANPACQQVAGPVGQIVTVAFTGTAATLAPPAPVPSGTPPALQAGMSFQVTGPVPNGCRVGIQTGPTIAQLAVKPTADSDAASVIAFVPAPAGTYSIGYGSGSGAGPDGTNVIESATRPLNGVAIPAGATAYVAIDASNTITQTTASAMPAVPAPPTGQGTGTDGTGTGDQPASA